jgi:hypothetical protein
MKKRLMLAASLLSTMLLPAAAQAGDIDACGKPITTEKQIQRLSDIAEISNVASSHEYYHGALMHKEEIENSWSKREDVTWTNGTDKYANRTSFWKFYVDNLKTFPHKGALWYHMLTTPYIEVSADGQTAKGIFMSFGNVSGEIHPGQPMSQWTEEKYGMDFIKEDGHWKIWHLRTYVEFYVDVNKLWTDSRNNLAAVDTLALQGRNPDGSLKAGVQEEAGSTFYNVKPDEKKVFYPGYTTSRDPQYNPMVPKPYCTFSQVEAY